MILTQRDRSRILVPALAACASKPVRPLVTAVPMRSPVAERMAAGAPVFEKVPPEDNPTLQELTAPEDRSASPYLLEVEDVIDISIYGEEEFQHVEVPVRPDGKISFAFIGDIEAAGRSVEQVRQEMTDKLSRYLRSPQVTLIAKQFSQKKVYVGGEVRNPGVVYLGGRGDTLMDALYSVGLVTNKADLTSAYLMRGNTVVAADFGSLIRGNLARNIRLRNDDVVYIPENLRRYIYVLGEVRNSNAVEVTQPTPIIEVISRCGGLTVDAKAKEIAIIRGGLIEPQIALVNVKMLLEGDLGQNILIEPGDIVYVPKSALGKYKAFIDVILRSIAPLVQGAIVGNNLNP